MVYSVDKYEHILFSSMVHGENVKFFYYIWKYGVCDARSVILILCSTLCDNAVWDVVLKNLYFFLILPCLQFIADEAFPD